MLNYESFKENFMKTNIIIVGSIYNKTKEISEFLANKFDLYYANVEDIISYRLFNADDIKKKCGEGYFKKLKKDIISEIGNFENTLICIKNSLFLDKDNTEKLIKYGTVVFLDFSKNIFESIIKSSKNEEDKKALQVEEITFEEKEELCKKYSDVSIELNKDNFESNCKQVKKILEKYFL